MGLPPDHVPKGFTKEEWEEIKFIWHSTDGPPLNFYQADVPRGRRVDPPVVPQKYENYHKSKLVSQFPELAQQKKEVRLTPIYKYIIPEPASSSSGGTVHDSHHEDLRSVTGVEDEASSGLTSTPDGSVHSSITMERTDTKGKAPLRNESVDQQVSEDPVTLDRAAEIAHRTAGMNEEASDTASVSTPKSLRQYAIADDLLDNTFDDANVDAIEGPSKQAKSQGGSEKSSKDEITREIMAEKAAKDSKRRNATVMKGLAAKRNDPNAKLSAVEKAAVARRTRKGGNHKYASGAAKKKSEATEPNATAGLEPKQDTGDSGAVQDPMGMAMPLIQHAVDGLVANFKDCEDSNERREIKKKINAIFGMGKFRFAKEGRIERYEGEQSPVTSKQLQTIAEDAEWQQSNKSWITSSEGSPVRASSEATSEGEGVSQEGTQMKGGQKDKPEEENKRAGVKSKSKKARNKDKKKARKEAKKQAKKNSEGSK